jgi:hypothetical protein
MFKTWMVGLKVASYVYMVLGLMVIWIYSPLLGEAGKLIFVFGVVNAFIGIVFNALIGAETKKTCVVRQQKNGNIYLDMSKINASSLWVASCLFFILAFVTGWFAEQEGGASKAFLFTISIVEMILSVELAYWAALKETEPK